MTGRATLVSRISGELRGELAAGNYPVGSKLPSETELATRFGASRPTVRAALRELQALSLVRTQHGLGTFVTDPPTVKAGLERLGSITDSIRSTGKTPGMIYFSRIRRRVLPEEAVIMSCPTESEVLELRRTILADGEVVAYSYDLIPAQILPKDFDDGRLEGSLFNFFRSQLGIDPSYGEAEIHAVHSQHIGWGREAAAHDLFVLLNQLHYDSADRLVLYSRTYFIENRYNFTVYRKSN
ncbi:GntR family transcriptional regulator [Propionimicrobium sp. PCR01-08-3]|uniref:GntR family transcriptional regulator n=1 Tax=Propionimicrobium sp. PCR01-08-3 TaxID=3052086 RepID=UPI00255CD8A5|nr:GntR family transcriptional regulator [Propionimicrobium sp. PCR01-08-3]WIY82408.1 GntR family transcriptional regulator [Propionimicrobium sp. PCR01-08-3]